MSEEESICPVVVTLSLIEGKWKTLILRDLLDGKKRFGELQRSVEGISQKVLTSQLRALESNGIVKRIAYAEIPPRVEYQLTDQGKSLHSIIDAMRIWGENFQNQEKANE